MKQINHANRGMGLETLIEYANEQYRAKNIATIQKVATPWKVIRKGKEIVSAYPEKKSTVDFIGVYKKIAIAFDAKQTENKTKIPLGNFEDHQIQFLIDWERNGGAAFYIIHFKTINETYYLHITDFFEWFVRFPNNALPLDWIRQKGCRLSQRNGIVLDYLPHIFEITEVTQ